MKLRRITQIKIRVPRRSPFNGGRSPQITSEAEAQLTPIREPSMELTDNEAVCGKLRAMAPSMKLRHTQITLPFRVCPSVRSAFNEVPQITGIGFLRRRGRPSVKLWHADFPPSMELRQITADNCRAFPTYFMSGFLQWTADRRR